MRRKFIAVLVSVAALAVPATALADGNQTGNLGAGGTGQAQISDQVAKTLQLALSEAKATQDAVNANSPSNVAGGDVSTGANSADQTTGNNAESNASNDSQTNQSNTWNQGTGCGCGSDNGSTAGSGGTGQAQVNDQQAKTPQLAASQAKAKQDAVNANAPVNVAGGDISGGANSANQTATNSANSSASNNSQTNQSNTQTQTAGGSSCTIGCGGSGQAQVNDQQAKTLQLAASRAKAKQNAVNANAPVNVAGGDISGGANSANQTATNGANSNAGNYSQTAQSNTQTQTAGGSSCVIGCGGTGQAQISGQDALTLQVALSKASAKQNTVNANVPVNVAGGDISSGAGSANQTATNGASGGAGNSATTSQNGGQSGP
jgi:hypothetical protein